MVTRSVRLLLDEKEESKFELLIIPAMLHDIGWMKVHKTTNPEEKAEAIRIHIEDGSQITSKIMNKVGCRSDEIDFVKDLIDSHKHEKPKCRYSFYKR